MLPCVPANFHSVARSLYIMSVAPAGNNSQNGFASVLTRLDWLLANLPTQLPQKDGAESCYQAFLSFGLDPDILEKTGDEVATLGEQLEGVFGWKTRTSGDGVIPILERGNAIRKLHPILVQPVLSLLTESRAPGTSGMAPNWGLPIGRFRGSRELLTIIYMISIIYNVKN